MKIAIDGPAGAGKSTVARRIADELGILYVDTGAMYRALTWKALQQKIDIEDAEQLHKLSASTNIDLVDKNGRLIVYCDGQDITNQIRTIEVSRWVSKVAADEVVRARMVQQQQAIAAKKEVIMDGRDITHSVLPDADYKFFLTASLEERTARRKRELEQQGYTVDYEQLKTEIAERDNQDMNREIGALKFVPGARLIDTSGLSVDDVVAKILTIIQED